jgi:hypothetical protein
VYLTASLRNVGPGIAIMHGWEFYPERNLNPPPKPEDFRQLTRDLYLAPGEVGFWQGAFRDVADPQHAVARDAIKAGGPVSADILYGDYEGGQRIISRFSMVTRDGHDARLLSATRHWHIDNPEPRNHQNWPDPDPAPQSGGLARPMTETPQSGDLAGPRNQQTWPGR